MDAHRFRSKVRAMTTTLPFATTLLAAIALCGAVLVAFSIAGLVRLLRTSVLARLPVLTEQDVTIAAAGTLVLCVEMPQLGSHFADVDFALRDEAGRDVPSAPIVFRAKVGSLSRVRITVRSFEIPRAGRYRLAASGLAGRDMRDTAIVLTRPFAAAMTLRILGIVLGGIALVGGFVLTALRLSGKL
jgi:hypothetical protein